MQMLQGFRLGIPKPDCIQSAVPHCLSPIVNRHPARWDNTAGEPNHVARRSWNQPYPHPHRIGTLPLVGSKIPTSAAPSRPFASSLSRSEFRCAPTRLKAYKQVLTCPNRCVRAES